MAEIVQLNNEVKLTTELIGDSVLLIHHTKVIDAIKRLVCAHEILELTLRLEQEEFFPDWGVLRDLHNIRCDLVTIYSESFEPTNLLPPYYRKMGRLFHVLNVRI
jgi:hypothetical protein